MPDRIDFQTHPSQYKHWQVTYDGAVATVNMDVDENGALFEGYQLKLNSYDLSVDIELADIVQRMRFEQPQISAIIIRSAKDNVFCAGANIRMLAGAAHSHKVNFCKFTNETRNTLEAAGEESAQHYIAAVRGACAGGGYELALACDEIYMTDDGTTSVALPEVPLLAVLPGTGGLTRVTDKRRVRRDLADVFCTLEEGVRGKKAKDWRLVDDVIKNSQFDEFVAQRALTIATNSPQSGSPQSGTQKGIVLAALDKVVQTDGSINYSTIGVQVDSSKGIATLTIHGPKQQAPSTLQSLHQLGDQSWLLKAARELDDALLHLRFNELELGVLQFKSVGDPQLLLDHERLVSENAKNDWLCREIQLYWKRVLQRVDLTSRSMVALIEHGSCFAGLLAELLFSVDRSYMMDGEFENDDRHDASLVLSPANLGFYPMCNGLTRLQTRFLGDTETLSTLAQITLQPIQAAEAMNLGLITFAYDDIDWDDEVRIFLEERTSFSPDALTGMEANLRFAGPETMVSRIFGRLTAWQNWIFQRPNAVGEQGALRRYGSGSRADFDLRRV